jgi:2-keto-myo-inositol isomerase
VKPRLFINGATVMNTPTDRVLEVARAAGFDGIEARAERLLDHEGEVPSAARAARAHEVWSLNGVRLSLKPDGSLDSDTLAADLGPRLEVCAQLQADYLLAVPPRVPGLPGSPAIAGIREGLEVARDEARKTRIRVAFEFLGFADCPINTPKLAAEVVDPVDEVDLVLDSCHWHASGGGSLEGFPCRRIAMVHLNDAPAKPPREIEDADRVLPGEGVIRLRDLLDELKRRGYRGPYSLETFNPTYWQEPPEEVARRGKATLDRLFSDL